MSGLARKLAEAQAAEPSLLASLRDQRPNHWDSPETWDWSADPEPPVYLVDGFIEQGTITVLTADTGAGKSWVAMALSVCVATGQSFLDRAVAKGCVMYVDEENPRRIPHSRLRALGMTN